MSDEGLIAPRFEGVNNAADILLLPGDLTDNGLVEEARVLVRELAGVMIPILAVLGNHDYASDMQDEIVGLLNSNGIRVLDGGTAEIEARGERLGVAGAKGFRGGFGKNALEETFEPETAIWVAAAEREARKIEHALGQLSSDYRLVMLHYAPVRATVEGEHPEIVPFMGSSRLSVPIDRLGADLVVHGHAHHGSRTGATPGGIPVYNVAASLLDTPFALLELGR